MRKKCNKKNKKNQILKKMKNLKKSSIDILNSIKPDFILEEIFNYINLNQKLKIVQKSKNPQKRLKIGIQHYIFNKIYKKLEKGEKINIDFNYSDNHEDIIHCINREFNYFNENKKIIIDFFNDIYDRYYNKYIIVNYLFPMRDCYIRHYFKFLVSLNCPIKICVRVPIFAFIKEYLYDHSYNDSCLFKDTQEIALKTFDLDINVFGFDFFFEHGEELYCEYTYENPNFYEEFFLDSFLNKINKKFEDLEYVRIHSHLLNSLIIEHKNTFFENNFKQFEIYNEKESCFIGLIKNIDKIKSILKMKN